MLYIMKKKKIKNMKVQVSLPRHSYGTSKADILEKAVRFYGKKILGARLANTLQVKVHVRKSVCNSNTKGQVFVEDLKPRYAKKFRIQLNDNYDMQTLLQTLSHEMVHVRQFSRNQLTFKDGNVQWNGNDLGKFADQDYWSSPWEVEARAEEETYYKQFRMEI